MQVFEMTKGIQTGDEVTFTGDMLSVELKPGLLGQVFYICKQRSHHRTSAYNTIF